MKTDMKKKNFCQRFSIFFFLSSKKKDQNNYFHFFFIFKNYNFNWVGIIAIKLKSLKQFVHHVGMYSVS